MEAFAGDNNRYPGPTQDPDCDIIIFRNGSFVQWPEDLPAN
jgi:hypothetical protein